MTFAHGKGTGLLVDEHDLTAYFNSSDATKTVDADDVTTWGHDDKVYLSGLEDGNLSLGGFYDGAEDAVDQILAAAFSGQPIVTLGLTGVGTLGGVAVLLQAVQTEYSISSPTAPVTISAAMQAKDGVRVGGKIAHALQERAGNFVGDPVDDGASSAFGAVAHLHLVELDGTDIDVRLQHSDDDVTYADLVAWTGQDAVGAVRTQAAGIINRYVRVIVDGGTFTTARFAVSYARHRRA